MLKDALRNINEHNIEFILKNGNINGLEKMIIYN